MWEWELLCGLGKSSCVCLLQAPPRVISMGSMHLNSKPTFSTLLELRNPWTGRVVPSRAQVRTDKVLYNLQAHFGIVFLIQHLEASKDSSLTWKCQLVPKVSSQVPVKPQPLRWQHQKLPSPSPSSRQSEHQPLPSPFHFKSSLCGRSLENPLIFLESSSSLATSSSQLTFIEVLDYIQALL